MEMLRLTTIQLASLVFTTFAVVGLGAFSARTIKSAEGYSLNGRSAGVGLITGGITGTVIGGSATVGTAQMAAVFGLSAWWFTLGSGLALIILAAFYAQPLRRTGLATIPQYLSKIYGHQAGVLASLISSLGILFSIVASALSGIHLIAAIFATSHTSAAAIIVLLVIAYVVFGGMKGAGVSGLLKMMVLGVALLVAGLAATVSLYRMPDLSTSLPMYPWFSLLGRGTAETAGNALSLLVGVICTQTYVQAVYSASDARTAAIGTITAAVITIPVGLPSIAVGMFMHLQHPDIAPVLALPVYLMTYMPGWIGGIGLAGILLSIVGSIAGLALGIGTMIANDIGRDLFGVRSDARVLLINRTSVAAVTCVALVIALCSLNSYVLDWNYMSMALRGGGVFLPLSLAVFRPGALDARWSTISMLASTVAAVLCWFILPGSINPLFAGLAVSCGLISLALLAR
jgi:solute:Na+ symporter, SSS family